MFSKYYFICVFSKYFWSIFILNFPNTCSTIFFVFWKYFKKSILPNTGRQALRTRLTEYHSLTNDQSPFSSSRRVSRSWHAKNSWYSRPTHSIQSTCDSPHIPHDSPHLHSYLHVQITHLFVSVASIARFHAHCAGHHSFALSFRCWSLNFSISPSRHRHGWKGLLRLRIAGFDNTKTSNVKNKVLFVFFLFLESKLIQNFNHLLYSAKYFNLLTYRTDLLIFGYCFSLVSLLHRRTTRIIRSLRHIFFKKKVAH